MNQEPNKVIYSMVGVSKYYDKKPVLKDIYLSYFYGAKIGVLGLNGAGKSSLLKILAGVDTEHQGETVLSPGHTVGYLEQEPLVDETKTVREVVEEGVQELADLLKEFNEISEKFAEPMSDDEMQQLVERQGEVQEKIDQIAFYDGRCHAVPAGEIYADAERLARELNGHYMDQFTFAERVTDWRSNNNIAESIFTQMRRERYPEPDWIVMSAGTGGTSATIDLVQL